MTMFNMTPLKWFAILAVVAVVLALGLPPNPRVLEQLNTSESTYRLAVASVLIPYLLIWYAAFYAFAKLRDYSRPIKDTKDGKAFHKISIGMGVVAFSLVVPTITGLILNNIAIYHPAFQPYAVIIINYVNLFPGLVAFLLLYNGARMLSGTVRGKTRRLDLRWHAPWFLLLAIVFSHLTLENHYRFHPYHLDPWVLVVTYIVPYLYGWMVGLLSAYELRTYANNVKGVLYRSAVGQFATGIAVTVLGSIAIQFINITLAKRVGGSLGMVLLINYVLLAVVAVGLVMMALGTKKLKRIEET